MRTRLYFTVAIVGGMLAYAGCGNPNGAYPVFGKVLYKGEPAKGAVVYFHRKSVTDPLQEHTPQGVVQEDGTFTLASPLGKGALPGEYVVLIEWKEGAGKIRGRSAALTAPDRFRGRYMDLKKPRFQAEVKTEKTQLPPFELQ
jgi:hypothetical protein